jgi:FKBP-type peptidyl-prolyl cis-trans isomerase
MKAHAAIVLGAALLAGVIEICPAAEKPGLKEGKEKISYSVGWQIVDDFKQRGVDIDPDLLMKGIQDAAKGTKPLMTPDEMRRTMEDLKKTAAVEEKRQQISKAMKRLQEGEAFLAENGKKEGVVTLPSGLQYQVITAGTGRSPVAADNVTVHYRGTLIDGTEFDSTYKRNKPMTFRVDRVIPGWREGLTRMNEGAKWKLFVPAKLGYGMRGAGPKIPPNSTLLIDVELLSVNPAPAGTQAPDGKGRTPAEGTKRPKKQPARPQL